jgi:hypothetical protein
MRWIGFRENEPGKSGNPQNFVGENPGKPWFPGDSPFNSGI